MFYVCVAYTKTIWDAQWATKKNKIQTVTVPYDEGISDVKGLLEATVAWCVNDYNRRRRHVAFQ